MAHATCVLTGAAPRASFLAGATKTGRNGDSNDVKRKTQALSDCTVGKGEIAHSPDASNKFAYDDSAQTFALYMMYWEKIK